ncbi:MAG TPA: ATP-binding protein, partial [Actinomycetes bacterium]|nr:ATP-binding protein [Actinomycetes bacterium]
TAPSGAALEELIRLARRLRMPYLRKAALDVIPTARAQRWDPAEVLRVLLAEEIAGRDQATVRLRRRRAGFPAGKTFHGWDEHRCSIPPATQQALRTLEWVDRRCPRTPSHVGSRTASRVGRRRASCPRCLS